jgi:predicted amidophosphoribosyltransferase
MEVLIFGVLVGIAGILSPLIFLILADRRKCPHCAGWINPDAKVCKHCGRDVAAAATFGRATWPNWRDSGYCARYQAASSWCWQNPSADAQ